MNRLIITLTLLLAACPLAFAAEPVSLDTVAEQFLDVPGFEPVDVDLLELKLEASLPPSGSVFTASGQLDPLERAVRSLQLSEDRASRARYVLHAGIITVPAPPAADPVPLLLVELHRFNLAEAIHAGLTEELGAGNVADLAEFEPGPDVSWRLVLQQVMGMNSWTVAAARQELELTADCPLEGCRLTAPLLDGLADWRWAEPLGDAADAALFEPEVLLARLLQEAAFDAFSHEAAWEAGSEPVHIATVIIETGLGQDLLTEAALWVGALADDSVAAIWNRLVVMPAAADVMVIPATAFECRRGTSEEGLCL